MNLEERTKLIKSTPDTLTDEELAKAYSAFWGTTVGNFRDSAAVPILVAEMNRRSARRSEEVSLRLAQEGVDASRASFWVSLLALVVALASLCASFAPFWQR